VVKHVGAAELLVVEAAVLVVAANAVLVVNYLEKLVWLQHLPACMCAISRKKTVLRRGARGIIGRGGAKKRKKLRVAVWHGKHDKSLARARVSRTRK
jgi:hypothetical protein